MRNACPLARERSQNQGLLRRTILTVQFRRQAERAGVWDGCPKGRDVLFTARFTTAIRQRWHAITTAQRCEKEAEMTCDFLRERERARRRVLWALATFHPGDLSASDLLVILDDLDDQERNAPTCSDKPLELIEVRNAVSVIRHNSGIDIILEQTIPQPWRERFNQASIGSTRLLDGPYASDWYKFLACWQSEMQHLDAHRAACSKAKLD